MEYTFTQAEQPKEFSADKPRPVLDDGQYLCRIIHTERKEYKEVFKKLYENLQKEKVQHKNRTQTDGMISIYRYPPANKTKRIKE